jgi:hypothetical protein
MLGFERPPSPSSFSPKYSFYFHRPASEYPFLSDSSALASHKSSFSSRAEEPVGEVDEDEEDDEAEEDHDSIWDSDDATSPVTPASTPSPEHSQDGVDLHGASEDKLGTAFTKPIPSKFPPRSGGRPPNSRRPLSLMSFASGLATTHDADGKLLEVTKEQDALLNSVESGSEVDKTLGKLLEQLDAVDLMSS